MKREIHAARARAGITSDSQLSQAAGVSYDTFMNWYGGRTTPRPFEVRKVADVLGVPYGDLLAAYDGLEPPEQPLQDAVRELIRELRTSVADERQARTDLMRLVTGALVAASVSVSSTSRGHDRDERR